MRLIDADALKKAIAEFHQKENERLHTPLWGSIGLNALDRIIDDMSSEIPKGEWKVIGGNAPNNIWHVFCHKCNCDMFTEFTSYCPNCGEPKKEINIAELTFKEADDDKVD